MECRPFNIDVMLVAPAAVKSNISKNQAPIFQLPEDSLYRAFLGNIMARMHASQTSQSMSTDVFAKRVVTKALARKPPSYLSIGGFAIGFYILKWLPRSWMLSFMWRLFSRKK